MRPLILPLSLAAVAAHLTACTIKTGTYPPYHGEYAPDLVASVESLDFGEVPVGAIAEEPVLLTNDGVRPLEIWSVGMAKATEGIDVNYPPEIHIDWLEAGDEIWLLASFEPADALPYGDTVIIQSNEPGPPLYLPMQGEGIWEACLEPDVDVLDFRTAEPDGQDSLWVDVANCGNVTITIEEAALSGSDAFSLSGDDPAGQALEPGEVLRLTVIYTPAPADTGPDTGAVAGDTAELTLTADGAVEPVVVLLVGDGAG